MSTKASLETELAVVAGFNSPQVELEQYLTPPEIAAHIIHIADLQNDIGDRTVIDLGTGTGMLALGAAFRAPNQIIGIDRDRSALQIAKTNQSRVGIMTAIEWVLADVTQSFLCPQTTHGNDSVTVVMNPPFGAQHGQKHADRAFLTTAAQIADVSYSIHNSGSQSFIESFVADVGGTTTHAFEASFNLDRQYEFHAAESANIDTEVYRIEWTDTDRDE
ncbi:MAG: putative RNA methylase [Haloquadratum walsbyi J07HQW1]|jgi:putative methylase|uniref:Putative RNA methylase n=1 Tax=Haloquadratum walsbyi J07HQW1 TaxID=1238424 RepID=U1MN24_9EURY|nr:MAG: putative RNA methylase [Haloquadratum walsbyi J07HQW1]